MLGGKRLSEVSTINNVVFNEDFQTGIWTKYPGNPVVVRSQPWAESHYICEPNILHQDGLFRMWFAQMFPASGKTALGYATSPDGFTWTKHPDNPVLVLEHTEVHRPLVMPRGGKYYLFAVDDENGEHGPATMRRWSSVDGIKWGDERLVLTGTQKWERNGLSNMAVVTDATMCEADGRVFLMYQGAQTPLGIATFDGTFADLAERVTHPALSRWEPSFYGMVEDCTLKLADNDSDRSPLVVTIPDICERYAIQTRLRCYEGPTHRVSVVMCYADENAFARVWLHDSGEIFYQECLNGLFSLPGPIGRAATCDDAWHDWEIKVDGPGVRLTIDGRMVGEARISSALLRALDSRPVAVGFSTHDTWVSIAHLRVESIGNSGEGAANV